MALRAVLRSVWMRAYLGEMCDGGVLPVLVDLQDVLELGDGGVVGGLEVVQFLVQPHLAVWLLGVRGCSMHLK